jgi:DNA-binding PadR family transcriptional regulator
MYLVDMSTADHLSPTARVILGMLRFGSRTGYEIKQKIEISTRFFWGASYGQIYPELKRLERLGLVAAEADPRGGVKRTAYELTPAGEDALHSWLADPGAQLFEMRDEALLKIFFADLLTDEELLAVVRARREWCENVLGLFHQIDETPVYGWGPRQSPTEALSYGVELIEWMRDWYSRKERELTARARSPRPAGTQARDRR